MKLVLVAAWLAVAAGCASAPRQDDERACDKAAEAVFAGAAIGSVLGEAIGGGGVAATLLGAVGGGITGHELANASACADG